MARRTAGFTGAEPANFLNQAALAGARRPGGEITAAHLDEVLAMVMLGPARRSREVAEQDRIVSAREAGHARAGLLVPSGRVGRPAAGRGRPSS